MGFYGKRRKCQLTLIFVTIIQSLSVPFASLSSSALLSGTRTGQEPQGTVIKEPPPPDPDGPVGVGNCRPKNPHEIKTLAVKSSKLIFSGYEQGQEAGLGRCALTLLIN